MGVKKTFKKFWVVQVPRKNWKWRVEYASLNPLFVVSIKCPKCKTWADINGRFVAREGTLKRLVECLGRIESKRPWPKGDVQVCGYKEHLRLALWDRELPSITKALTECE